MKAACGRFHLHERWLVRQCIREDREQCTIADKKNKKYSTKLATQDTLQVMWFGSDIVLTDYYHKGHQACGLLEEIQNVQLHRIVSWNAAHHRQTGESIETALRIGCWLSLYCIAHPKAVYVSAISSQVLLHVKCNT